MNMLICRNAEKDKNTCKTKRIITGSDRRPETKQGIEGKIVMFRSEPDHRSEAINFGAC